MRVYVVAASDAEPDTERKKRWGDYWFKDSLCKALGGLGHEAVERVDDAEVLIHLHGYGVERLPEWTYNIIWIHSHPDAVDVGSLGEYDAVFCESERFTAHLREQGVACEWLPGASDFVPMDSERAHQAVFVGNWRPGRSLPVTRWPLRVWGEGWEGHLPEGATWAGTDYPHEALNALYASNEETPDDSHEDMRRWGFTTPREYDVRATRGQGAPTFAQCAERMMAGAHRLWGLDLGCGEFPRPLMCGIDKIDTPNGYTMDLEDGLPLFSNEADVIVADNILEHITNLIPLMNDCHRALIDTGRMHIRVPSATTTAAFQDPTHVRFFVPETFDYFEHANERWQRYGRTYGIKPWRIVKRKVDGRFIDVTMRPVRDAENG